MLLLIERLESLQTARYISASYTEKDFSQLMEHPKLYLQGQLAQPQCITND